MLRLCAAVLALGLAACEMPDMGAPPDADVGEADAGPMNDSGRPLAEDLRINQMQMRATVNSYHDFVFDSFPDVAWRHPRLSVQLDQGIRVFDFDVVGDRVSWIGVDPATSEWLGDATNNCGAVRDGEQVRGNLHMCLREMSTWCDAHPEHPLLVILVGEGDPMDQPPQLPWQLDDLEGHLVTGLGRERLLVPADLRGAHATVWDAIQAEGWPTVDETRGKVMVVLNDRGPTRFAYLMNGGRDPTDRLMFVVGDPESAGQEGTGDEVVFTFEPDGTYEFETDLSSVDQMRGLVRRGFLVHGITDNPVSAERLWGAGVHFVGSRFPEQVFRPVEGSPTVCNPVTAPDGCRDDMFEAP